MEGNVFVFNIQQQRSFLFVTLPKSLSLWPILIFPRIRNWKTKKSYSRRRRYPQKCGASRVSRLRRARSALARRGAIPPIADGIAVLMDPLRRKQGDADFTRVTLLDALPENGTPKRFTIYADKQDAWGKFYNTAIGAIYLCRKSDGKIDAFNVVCPHLGFFSCRFPRSEA